MTYLELYNHWLNHPNVLDEDKESLRGLNNKEIEDAFYTDVKFGTAGMRGLMGMGPNRLNIYTIRKATLAFANYLIKNHKEKVAIAYDNRYNSSKFAFDCANLLANRGIKVYIFNSLRPTPELSFVTRYFKCDGGIMITASHNPKEYNGYKLYDETGCQLIPELAQKVIDEIALIDDYLDIEVSECNNSRIEIIDEKVDEAYIDACLGIQLRKDLNKDFTIAFSPEHGTSYIPVCDVLKRAGYHVEVVKEQAFPDPAFSNTKSPNPEELAAFEGVKELGKKINADLLLVCDPDGDRMGVGVKKDDDYVILNGNQTGALLLEYILRSHDDLNIKINNPCMFNTIVTSDIGEAVARSHNVDNERTLTGFKYIGNKVKQYEISKEKTYVFGYEESYGSLISPFVRDKDATQACLMLAEACAYCLEKKQTLLDLMEEIYQNVGYYYDSQISIMLPGADGASRLQEIMKDLRNNPLVLEGYQVLKIEDYKLQKAYVDNKEMVFDRYDVSDVIKYYLNDGSFIAIRPSGTEPKCKIYLSIKADSMKQALDKNTDFTNQVKKVLN